MAMRNYRPTDVTYLRNLNQTYRNNNPHAIEVRVLILHNEVDSQYSEFIVGGVVVDRHGGHVTDGTLYYRYTLSAIVPPNTNYIVNSRFIKEVWIEEQPIG